VGHFTTVVGSKASLYTAVAVAPLVAPSGCVVQLSTRLWSEGRAALTDRGCSADVRFFMGEVLENWKKARLSGFGTVTDLTQNTGEQRRR